MSSDSIKLQAYVVPLALLAAATRISIDLIPKLTGMNPIFYYLSFILCFFLEILFIVYVTKSFKERNNNVLTFQEGLTSAKYTLLVDVVWMYPGYNVVMAKKGAKVTTVLTFVETANKSNVLAVISSENAPGDVFGGSFSNEDRIREGFAKTGKTLAELVLKNVK